ncbi:MAG: hypothetical protein R3234_03535, partial [Thermoanaerobaculia bacterium]|nr:hypothetical protein [Thermoanaerobaculia bacterium]
MEPRRLLRPGLALASLALVAWGVLHHQKTRDQIQEIRRVWEEMGIAERRPEADREIRRATDPVEARLLVGRAVLADSLHAGWLAKLDEEAARSEVRSMEQRLETAENLARGALRQRPSRWEAPLVLGGSRFLSAWRDPDAAPYEAVESWGDPLRLARRLAPGHPEPVRLLATATLTAWTGLSATGRAEATELLEEAFEDPRTVNLLLPTWMTATDDSEILESVLPDRPEIWKRLQERYAENRRWDRLCGSRDRWWRSLRTELAARIREAGTQTAQGDPRRARQTLLGVLRALPPDRRTHDLLERAIDELPPGPVGPGTVRSLEDWLRWAFPLWLRDLPTLAPRTFARIAGLARDLPPWLRAQARLAAGDLETAESIERRAERLWSRDWG